MSGTAKRSLTIARSILNRTLNTFGLEMGLAGQSGDWTWFFRNISRLGFRPGLILDIGVAYGTPVLYRMFPKAQYILFDPAKGSVPYMQKIAQNFDARFHNVALGREAGTLMFDERADLVGSTLFDEIGEADSHDHYEVPMHRLDELVPAIEKRPCLVKIDVQGAELMVIEGMTAIVDQIDMIIVESSLLSTLEATPEVAEVITLMSANGFVLYDLLGFERRPLDNCLAQADLVFVPVNSKLRQDRRWSA